MNISDSTAQSCKKTLLGKRFKRYRITWVDVTKLDGSNTCIGTYLEARARRGKTTPRGEFTLKKFAGRLFGAANASGTPSQLISRRPEPKEPATFGLSVPRSKRYWSTAACMVKAAGPKALRTTWAEEEAYKNVAKKRKNCLK